MDLTKVLTQLRAELENLNMAIASLEKLASANRTPSPPEEPQQPRRPGRPRKNAAAAGSAMAVQKRGAK